MKNRQGVRMLAALALGVFFSCGAVAQMKHVEVGRRAPAPESSVKEQTPPLQEEGKEAAGAAAFTSHKVIVTPVTACFDQMKKGEAATLRRDFADPWHECQRRLKSREEKQASEKETGKKDGTEKESSEKSGPKGAAPGAGGPSEK